MRSDDEGLRVVAAAVKHRGEVHSLPPPARHHDVLRMMHESGIQQDGTSEQGFLLSNGRFCRRRPACVIAERAGQIIEKTHPKDVLFSEDLW